MSAFDEFANSYLRSMEDDEKGKALEMLNELLNIVLSVNQYMTEVFNAASTLL